MAEVVLVRHGATEWSSTGRHTSVTDVPLTAAGRAGARAVGDWLVRRGWAPDGWAAVLVSPRARARETCALAGLGGRAEEVGDLAEWAYGDYEGLTTDQIRESEPDWTVWDRGGPGGESPTEVSARADRVLSALRARSAAGPVAVFSHGHFLRVLGARWVGLPAGWGRALVLDAGSASVLGHERETPALRLWNYRPAL